MIAKSKVGSAGIFLLLTAACEQSDEVSEPMIMKQIYSLCPHESDARGALREQMMSFASAERARLVDRSAGAQRELASLGSEALSNTGGQPTLLIVEKLGEFRVTVTNIGLETKFALLVRTDVGRNASIVKLIDDLRRSWTVREVTDGVTDNPPC